MASAQSPTLSSAGLSQLIDQILHTDKDAPDFDLEKLEADIENLLAYYEKTNLGKKSSTGLQGKKLETLVDGLPSASDAAVFSEGVSKNVKIIATQISEYSGDKHSTAISVLTAVGNVHWLGLGFLLVAAVINRLETIKNNKIECFKLLKSMHGLAKVISKLKRLPQSKVKMQKQINESIGLIVEGAILCCAQKKTKGFKRFYKASKDKKDLEEHRSNVKEMRRNLILETNVESLSILENSQICNPPDVPDVDYAVGIEQRVDDVVKLLELDEDKPAAAVVVHGFGGSGKTTLADAVYSSLQKGKLQGWKHSKVTLIQNLERDPKVEPLQSLILQHLTGMKQDVTDFQSGQQRLKDIMEKESIFLYIDNALFIEPLQKLLPREITSPKKLRLLVTSRKSNVSEVMQDCRIKCCEIYPMESLPLEAAIQVLCRKIDRESDVKSILENRPQMKKIAEKCSCCPLVLEVVGGYIRRRKNQVEAYERVIDWLRHGEPFSGDKEYSFDEKRIMFAYQELESSAQEAFLDICSFFSSMEWDLVECIVGDEDMKCLEEGALIKRLEEIMNGKKVIKISVHDLLLGVGRIKSKGNRFRTADEFTMALQNDKLLLPQVKGVRLWGSKRPFHISSEVLDAMSGSLRVFAIGRGNLTTVKGKCSKSFDKLRFLQSENATSLPIDILKLTSLTYIGLSLKDDETILSRLKLQNLSSLKVLQVLKRSGSSNLNGIGEYGHSNQLRQLVLDGFRQPDISSLVNLYSLQKLHLSWCSDLDELPDSLGKLLSLQELKLSGCKRLKQLPEGFGKLRALTTLDLSGCKSLKELPIDFGELSSLQYLYISGCKNLQELPSNFESLSSLQYLNLSGCSELLLLPEMLGCLASLNYLELSGCEKLTSLPHSLGQLTSLLPSRMSLAGCSSLRELPQEISWFATCKSISLQNCSSLKIIPNYFSKLICLEHLCLSGCESLEDLSYDFHCLQKLRTLEMSGCSNLLRLPDGFGKLRSLTMLDLSKCDKLKELCSDFHCLAALKELKLSRCYSLSQLPDCFGELGSLENLDLSECCNLEKLCHDFHRLPSLLRLNLSNCERLGGEWMDKVGVIPSLLCVDIWGNKTKMYQSMEMKRKEKECHFVAVTGSSRERTAEGRLPLILEAVIFKVFDKEGLLIDTQDRPFYTSSLQHSTPLVLIIDGSTYSESSETWKLLGKNLQWLEANSKLAFQIIYVGRRYNALTSVLLLRDRILAYTPHTSGTSSFLENLFNTFPVADDYIGVFRSSGDGLGEEGLKCLSAWEDISYAINEETFLTRTPRESNIEMLRSLLVTGETDFLLLHNNQQEKLKVDDLKGKVVLLLIAYCPISEGLFSVLEDVYAKMRGSQAEVVCIPRPHHLGTCDEYERDVSRFPWPVVPSPWLISEWKVRKSISHDISVYKHTDNIVVVDEVGRVSCKDALPNILRWGVEAYPFSKAREEELIKEEWEGVKCNSQSSLEFVFQNVEHVQVWIKEVISRGEIILVCVGPPSKMFEFASDLNFALAKLENVVRVLYVGTSGYSFKNEEKDYEMKRKEMCSITSLSSPYVYKFWVRLTSLLEELSSKGVDEKTVQVRRIVLGFVNAELQSEREFWQSKECEAGKEKGKGIRIMAVDEKGEMISWKGNEVVQLLCQSDEEEHHNLLVEMRSEGFRKIVKERWRDGIHHPKHDPQHPLVELDCFHGEGKIFVCSICSKIDFFGRYRCSVCEMYEMCKKCCEC